MAFDLDRMLAYRTQKMVNLLDRRLGILFYSVQFIIVVYVFVFAIIINEGYIEEELALGQVELHVRGKTTFTWQDQEFVVDGVDMVDPPIEHNAVFVASRQIVVSQSRGLCGNINYECDSDADCPQYAPIGLGKCGSDGLCEELGWCPPLDVDMDPDSVSDWKFDHPENITLWFKASINFPRIAPDQTFTTMNDNKPIYAEDDPERVNAYRLYDLLEAAGLDPQDQSIREKGCMLNVRMQWNCRVDTGDGCAAPDLMIKRLDVGPAAGFDFYDADYKKDNGGQAIKDQRYLMKQIGYRLLVSSKGTGSRVSISAMVLQFSSGLALLTLARSVADGVMLFLLPERSHYRAYKEEETPDFSDIRDLREARAERKSDTVELRSKVDGG